MPTTKAKAQWKGSLGKGSGTMTVSGNSFHYSAPSRFEDGEHEATNPEELIGAAHAGCFSMALSGALSRAGYEATVIDTTAAVRISKGAEGWDIDHIALTVRAEIPGIDDETFQELAQNAKKGCPVSKALAGVSEITLDASLA